MIMYVNQKLTLYDEYIMKEQLMNVYNVYYMLS